jgi:hypothetical protein
MVHRLEIEGILHGENEAAVDLGDGNDAGLMNEFRWYAGGGVLVDVGTGEVYETDLEGFSESLDGGFLVRPSESYKATTKTVSGTAKMVESLVEVIGGEAARVLRARVQVSRFRHRARPVNAGLG